MNIVKRYDECVFDSLSKGIRRDKILYRNKTILKKLTVLLNPITYRIKVNAELTKIMKKYSDETMDYTFSQILFCKAIERHIRDCFIKGLRCH